MSEISEVSAPIPCVWYMLNDEGTAKAKRFFDPKIRSTMSQSEQKALSSDLGQTGEHAVKVILTSENGQPQSWFLFPKIFVAYTGKVLLKCPIGLKFTDGRKSVETASFVPPHGIKVDMDADREESFRHVLPEPLVIMKDLRLIPEEQQPPHQCMD